MEYFRVLDPGRCLSVVGVVLKAFILVSLNGEADAFSNMYLLLLVVIQEGEARGSILFILRPICSGPV